MARGWESKSVELQQSDVPDRETRVRDALTPEQVARNRRRQGVLLSRKRVEQQIAASSNPKYQHMLREALAELDSVLRQLED
jgi:hypothetical protein